MKNCGMLLLQLEGGEIKKLYLIKQRPCAASTILHSAFLIFNCLLPLDKSIPIYYIIHNAVTET